MTSFPIERTVGELVTERPSRSRIFEQYGIDYCCGGKRPLHEACAAQNVDVGVIAEALTALDRSDDDTDTDEVDPKSMSLTHLADHIVEIHHGYLRTELPRLTAMVHKVASVHGHRYSWLVEVNKVFAAFRAELESHMLKEERILFPLIRQMDQGMLPPTIPGGSVENPIRMMQHEHDEAAQALHRMRTLTNKFAPPADACNTFRAMLDGLQHLEHDTYRHIHKENNVLFPRAAELEASLTAAQTPRI